MQAWALLLFLSAEAESRTTTLEQVVGEYRGVQPSIDTPWTWKLSMRSDGTFRSELSDLRFGSEVPLVYEGRATSDGDAVTLAWELSIDAALTQSDGGNDGRVSNIVREAARFKARLLPVRWGKRLYLIEDSNADSFIRDVIRGDEPRSSGDGIHLLRVGDWKVRVSGRPEVPEDWKKVFPPDNFKTRVARQLAYHRAEIDAGSGHGLATGMLLTLYSSKYGATDLRVVSVTAGTAVIENAYGDPPLTKGTRVYSRIPDTVEAGGR